MASTSDDLFRWIEEQEAAQDQPWGRVLDAGTGRHSLTWLRALASSCADVVDTVAVTGDAQMAKGMEAFVQTTAPELEAREQCHARVRVELGNWSDQRFLEGEAPFDVIIADYLIGSLDGFAPYMQDTIIQRLGRHLSATGRLYIVGLEPLASMAVSADEDTAAFWIQEMARTRDACILLAGKRCYREMPMSWCDRQLRKNAFQVRNQVRFTNVYTAATIQRQLNVARNQLVAFRDEPLAAAMREALDRMDQQVRQVVGSQRIKYGFDYVLQASR